MKHILVIQSRKGAEVVAEEQRIFCRAVGLHGIVEFVSSLDDTVVWGDPTALLAPYDAVILGGSGDFDFDGGRVPHDEACTGSREIASRITPLVQYVFEHDFPLLGICFGHQLISEVLGVKVVNDCAQKKIGSFEVCLTEAGKNDPLFSTLPEKFFARYGHKDSLSAIPESAVLLARSEFCKTSALRFGSRVYSVQFHPELIEDDIRTRIARCPLYLPEGIDVSSFVRTSPEAYTLISRFITHIAT
jgi:GMP synthase (glutamine-hydrolysing)